MILKDIYTLVKNHLMTAGIGIVHFDLWNNQVLDDKLPFGFPAVFFEFNPLLFTSTGSQRQQTDMTFSLYICSEVIGEAAHDVSAAEYNAALEHLDLIDAINLSLQKFNGQTANIKLGTINRTELQPDHNHDSHVYVHVVRYRGRVVDDSAKINYTMQAAVLVPPVPTIDKP